MELKHYQKQNCVSVWSNSKVHGQLLASASPNRNNSQLFDLQILQVDLSDPAKTLQIYGKSSYDTSFRCLAWGTFGQKQGTLSYGLIFGGMENGSFTLWNPTEMIGKLDDVHQSHINKQNSLLYFEQMEEDEYPIICAQWNALKNNYLAFGSTSLLILDVSKDISSPGIFKPSQNNPHEGSYITSVAWNKQVSNILASAGSDGLIALYDIKTNRSIFNFKDNSSNNNQRQVQVAWSKQISTQIAVALDDEKKNQLQIWDLRNQKGPIVVIDKGHSKGINTMDWSQLDHDLILTASRDNRINCWNYKQDEQPLSSRKIESEIVKVAWSKSLPSIYSITTTDGISICSLDDRNIHSYIPKWLKVPQSSTFNGNQQLITYSEQRGNNLIQYKIKTEVKSKLGEQIAVLQQFIQNQNVDLVKQGEGQIGQFWKLICFKKNQEGDSDIYQFLGLNKQKIIKQVEKYTGKKRDPLGGNNTKNAKKNKSKSAKADYIPVPVTQAVNFFGSLSSQPLDKSFNKNNNNQDENQVQNIKYDMVPRNSNWDIGKQKMIKQNLLIGNYDGAIDAALKSGRTAQALLIAYSIDQATFNNTLKTFCTQTTDKFISGILRHIAFKDTQELVNRYDLNKWKQCVALIYSLSSSQKRKNLLNLLGGRLQTQQPNSKFFQQAAIYCFILSEDFQKIVSIYEQRLNKQRPGTGSRKLNLVILGTKLLAILSSLTININVTASFQKIIRQLAFVCLEANKKLVSYTLFTKYIANSSFKHINYLIQNTQQLVDYRNKSNSIINLPAMAKRQQKAKKTTKNTEYQEQVPTNIKPNVKQPKLIAKNAFGQDQSDELIQKKKGGNVPPPPPPPPPSGPHANRSNVVQLPSPPPTPPHPHPVVQKSKGTPLPPPPKRNQPVHQSDKQDGHQQKHEIKQTLPNFPIPKKGGMPPPPPPKNVSKTLNTSHQQLQNSSKNPPPPPPPPVKSQVHQAPHSTSRVPPPPPSHVQHHTTLPKQQPVSNQNRTLPPPPSRNLPPPPYRQVQKQTQQYKDQREEQNVKKQFIQSPKHTLPPPPAKNNQFSQPIISRPPPAAKKQQEPYYEQQQQYQQQQAVQTKKQANRQPPPPITKKIGPPPPPKVSARVETKQSQNQEQQQANTSFQQAKRPPPPPVKKTIAPPPPGRR